MKTIPLPLLKFGLLDSKRLLIFRPYCVELMRKKLLFLWMTLALSGTSYGQTTLLDSLRARIKQHSAADTLMADMLNEAAHASLAVNQDSAEAYAKRAETLSKEIGYKRGLAESYRHLGFAANNKGNIPLGRELNQLALTLHTENKDTLGIANAHYDLGNSYESEASYEPAVQEMIIASQLYEKVGDMKGQIYSLNTLAVIYYRINELDKALELFTKCAAMAKQHGERRIFATSLANAGNIHYFKKDSDKAVEYYNQAIAIREEMGDLAGQGHLLNNIATIYFSKGDYREAIVYHERAIALRKARGNQVDIVSSLNNIALNHAFLGEFARADQYLLEAAAILKQIKNKYGESVNLEHRYKLDSVMGRSDLAFTHFQQFVALRDSLMNAGKSQQIADLQVKYETEKKEQEIQRLSQEAEIQALELSRQRYLVAGVLLVALLGAVSGWLVYKQKTLKQHEALVLMEQKALRSQLNPHFIFNALGAIQNFMLQNKPEEAGGYMTRFARLMRQILENSREDYVSLEEEISTLENYLELQLLRFRGRFTYEIVVAGDIDREEVSIPPMFAQPFIENALEHGLKDMQSGGRVLVSFTRQHDHILLTVEDNGVGIGGTYVARGGHKSLAGAITAERVSLINKGLKRKIELIVEDLKAMEGGSGTRVKLAMPYKLV